MSTFSIVGDNQLCEYIHSAQRKLVYIAPGVNLAVAEALAKRLDDLGSLSVTVIVDTDPEVCRMGYGDLEALNILHKRAEAQQLALRSQPGLRLGILIADDAVMVYSSTPRLIEAGSTTEDKPNAIVLDAAASSTIEEAVGGDASKTLPNEAEIGRTVVTEAALNQTREDLKNSPPQRFDLARQARVFSSLIGYVELKIKGVHITQRRLKLPPDLLHADADDDLLGQLTADIRPIDANDDFAIELTLGENGLPVGNPPDTKKTEKYTPKRLTDEARKLREDYLFVLPNYGTVIYNAHKSHFEADAEAYKARLQTYLKQLSKKLANSSSRRIEQIAALIMRRLNGKMPSGIRPKDFPEGVTKESIESYVRNKVREAYEHVFALEGEVRWLYKSIAPESITADSEFLKAISGKFSESERRRLFEQFDAARGDS